MRLGCRNQATAFMAVILLAMPASGVAQIGAPALGHGGMGARAGEWKVPSPSNTNSTYSESLSFEAFFRRGLDRHVALETSFGIWRRITRDSSTVPQVTTHSYIVPIIISLKLFPVDIANRIEPYVEGGLGFGLGVQKEGTNAIGGGGTSIVTGFAMKASTGFELRVVGSFAVSAAMRYRWVKFGDRISDQEAFNGGGAEAGLTYRFGP